MEENKAIEINPAIISEVDKYNLEDANYEMLVQMGLDVSEVKVYAQWVLGKLASSVMKKYGDLKVYAHDINQQYEVVQQYLNTYRKFTKEDPTFTPEKYSGSVPWSMLQIVATKSDTPQEMMDDLVEKGVVTGKGAYKKIKEMETGVEIPHRPKLYLKWDYEIKKYRIVLDVKELDLIDWTDVKQQLLDYLEALK